MYLSFKTRWKKNIVTFSLGVQSLVLSNQFFSSFSQLLDYPICFQEDFVWMQGEVNPILRSHGSANVAIQALVHFLYSIFRSAVNSYSYPSTATQGQYMTDFLQIELNCGCNKHLVTFFQSSPLPKSSVDSLFLGGSVKFTSGGLQKYPEVSQHFAR